MHNLQHSNFLGLPIPDFKFLLKTLPTSRELTKATRFQFDDFFISGKGRKVNKAILLENFSDAIALGPGGKRVFRIKGAYIFWKNNKPIYVGISNSIIDRLKQHMLGKSHFSASLAFLIAKSKHSGIKNRSEFTGRRSDFPFDKYREDLQAEMRQDWWISIAPAIDDYQLHILEVYIASTLKTKWNNFATH